MRYEEVRVLTSITGIGVYSALVIYSEIGDGSRFPRRITSFPSGPRPSRPPSLKSLCPHVVNSR